MRSSSENCEANIWTGASPRRRTSYCDLQPSTANGRGAMYLGAGMEWMLTPGKRRAKMGLPAPESPLHPQSPTQKFMIAGIQR